MITAPQYLEAVQASLDLPDSSYCRVLVDITCQVNRRWLRDMFPDYPLSFRDWQAVALPYAAFKTSPLLSAQLRHPDTFLVIEAMGKIVVAKVPSN